MSVSGTQPLRKFVRAGAGAGKTWNLTREVVRFALNFHSQEGQWPKTVLTTFTRKATQELKERMLEYCLKEQPQALEFVQSTSFLQITTMHGLLHSFLGRYGTVLGLPNQLKVVDTNQADYWRKQILRDMIEEGVGGDTLQLFDFKRLLNLLKNYEEVYWDGKARPLGSPSDLENIMDELVASLSPLIDRMIQQGPDEDPGEKWPEYFQILAQLNEALKRQEPWAEKSENLKSLLSVVTKPRKSKKNPGLSEELGQTLDEVLASLKKWTVEPPYQVEYWSQILLIHKEFQSFAQLFMKRLTEKKKTEGALEPNDLEFYSLNLVQNYPQIIEKFSQDMDGWFIDEFQDTSPLQLKILEPMIGKKSCYIVGDPQQSIYLFRGSRSEVFVNKNQAMEKEGAEILFLQKNYRSQSQLLDFFNQVFPALRESFSAMEATQEAITADVAVRAFHYQSEDELTEIHHITGQLDKILKRGTSPKDICILARTHSAIEKLQKTLTSLGYPVISHSSSSFYKRREILDAMGVLKFLLNPWDDENLILLLRSPWLAMDDKDIVSALDGAKTNYWEKFSQLFSKQEDDTPGALLLKALMSSEKNGVAPCFRQALLDLGLFAYSQQIDSSGRREANLWKLVNLVERNAREPGASLLQLVNEGVAASSLEDIGDAGDASSPTEPNKIQLMTIHASKGLQFEHVFMPFLQKKPRDTTFQDFTLHGDKGLWSFRLPLQDHNTFVGTPLETLFIRQMKQREREESLRVLYVGMTRAMKHLYLSWSNKPEKNSWASLLEPVLDAIPESGVFKWEKVEKAGPIPYQVEKSQGQVRTKWQEKTGDQDQSIEEAPLEEKNWQQIMQSQSKRREGVVLHRMFETLKNHDVVTTIDLAKQWLPEKQEQVEKAIFYVWENPEVPLAEIIQQGHVEWGYQYLTQGQMKEKRVDLWGIFQDQLWIVDYKTGSAKFKEQAFEQMSEYAEALQKFLDWTGPIQLVAVYPFSQSLYQKQF